MPQSTGFHADLTVREVVTHFAAFYPKPLHVDDVIDMVGLGNCARSLVSRLSGGQQRRLDVAGDAQVLAFQEFCAGFGILE